MIEAPEITAREPTYRPLIVVFAAAGFGVVLDRYVAWPAPLWWLLALVAWIVWWIAWRRQKSAWAVAPLLLSVAATGAAWHHCRWSLFDGDEILLAAAADPGPAAIEGRVVSGSRRMPAPPPDPLRPIVLPERTRLEIDVLAIRDRDRWRPASGRTSVIVGGNLIDVHPGERVLIFGQLGAWTPPANPGEFDFAALSRAARRLCWVRCEFPESITRLSRGWSFWPTELVDALRTRGDALLWRNLDVRQRGLASAMFLGSRQELDPDLEQAFVETGTIHLLVVSGLNVGLLAAFLFAVMRVGLVPRNWALLIVAVACMLYAATTDAQPPVVRATVMVLLGCLAMAIRRRPLGFNLLAAAGLIVLAMNPAELFQAGTQLSFLAVGVLVYLSGQYRRRKPLDPLDRLIARTRPWPMRATRAVSSRMLRAVVTATLIWLVVCPLVMARFHLVSPAAIVLGPIVAVPVAIAMAAAFGIFLFGWLVPPLGSLLGAVCDVNLALLRGSVEWARDWPFSHFWVSGPADWWLAGFYAALAAWTLVPSWRPSRRWSLALVAGWCGLGLTISALAARSDNQLQCTFLSVGHGAAVVVQLPGGQTVLYDAGRLGTPSGAARAVSGFLWSRSITHLDAIVISHADLDHYNAIPQLVEQFSVGAVYVSPVMFDEPTPALTKLRAAIAVAGVPMEPIWSGDRLRGTGEVAIDVLHPPRGGVLGSDNANSIVLAIEHAGRRLLLTGDLESPGLDDVLAEQPYNCDVLMAPHHGSAASDPPGTGKPVCGIERKGAAEMTDFYVGMELYINEECVGKVTKMTSDKIFIESKVFTGWATKKEIATAIRGWAKAERCPDRPPRSPASGA